MDLTKTFESKKITRFDQNIFYLVAGLCTLIGYASNFFIYVLANPAFRKDLLRLFKRRGDSSPHSTSSQNTNLSSVDGAAVPVKYNKKESTKH